MEASDSWLTPGELCLISWLVYIDHGPAFASFQAAHTSLLLPALRGPALNMSYPANTNPVNGPTIRYSGPPVYYDHSPLRKGLYTLLGMLSVTLIGLTITRIVRTESVYPWGFYDRIIAELLATSLLTLPVTLHAFHTLERRIDTGIGRSFAHELGILLVLWILWLVGAAIATSHWTDLYSCWYLFGCRLLTAIVAISWSGFGVLTFLIIASAVLGRLKGGFMRPMHAQYSAHAFHHRGPSASARMSKENEAGMPTA
ncbi:hypothetical protein K523DRAFT_409244 [Schizophyllum commune Tattone D]|nr:hypothetical protein K523DRAFT_409244 [Schizophyllum commune Tattone D]